MTELKVIGVLVILAGIATALTGGLFASEAESVVQGIIAGLIAFIGGLLAGIGGNIISIASKSGRR